MLKSNSTCLNMYEVQLAAAMFWPCLLLYTIILCKVNNRYNSEHSSQKKTPPTALHNIFTLEGGSQKLTKLFVYKKPKYKKLHLKNIPRLSVHKGEDEREGSR